MLGWAAIVFIVSTTLLLIKYYLGVVYLFAFLIGGCALMALIEETIIVGKAKLEKDK